MSEKTAIWMESGNFDAIEEIPGTNNTITSKVHSRLNSLRDKLRSRTSIDQEPDVGEPSSGRIFAGKFKRHADLNELLDSNKDRDKLEAMRRIIEVRFACFYVVLVQFYFLQFENDLFSHAIKIFLISGELHVTLKEMKV